MIPCSHTASKPPEQQKFWCDECCQEKTNCCETCGEDDFSPNVEAFEISGKIVCDECAEEVFEENSQFGVGA